MDIRSLSSWLFLLSLLAPGAGTVASGATPRFTFSDLERYEAGSRPGSGDWLSFDLEPVTLRPASTGRIRFPNFTVVGDHERIEWQTGPDAPVYTFERQEQKRVDGLTLSVFEPGFPAAELRELPALPIRFDQYHVGGCWPLRLRPSAMPRARVVRINDRVQYSSHVVNLVVPWTWRDEAAPGVPPGDRFADVQEAIRIFYEHFEDAYQDLAFIPTRAHRSPIGGRVSIYTDVEGINIRLGDGRPFWAPMSEVVRGLHLHVRGDFLWNAHLLHETGHQWGFDLDLFDVAGIEPSVSAECTGGVRHMPLIAPEHSFMRDACLQEDKSRPPLCIRSSGSRGWVLAACEPPLAYHPFQLYAMGLLEPSQVPPLFLRQRQDRPRPHRAGARVRGRFVEVTIDEVIARYGERSGPAMEPVWRRAHIVLSPERLLAPADLRWFNFFARRVSDPEVTGIEGLDRSPSLEFATAGRVDLRTEILPRGRAPVAGGFQVSYPQLGKRDIAGLKLKRKLGTRYEIGRRYVVSGRVRSPGDSGEISVQIGAQRFRGEIGSDRRFSVEIRLDPQEPAPEWLTLRLEPAGTVLGRIGPVYVEEPPAALE